MPCRKDGSFIALCLHRRAGPVCLGVALPPAPAPLLHPLAPTAVRPPEARLPEGEQVVPALPLGSSPQVDTPLWEQGWEDRMQA